MCIRDRFLRESEILGELIAKGGHVCLNGAGKFGCMGAVNRGCQRFKGKVEGSIHQIWAKGGAVDEEQEGLTVLHVAGGATLAERKRLMYQDADAFIVLPGGPGTMDEAWEVICERQIGMPLGKVPRPVVFVNLDGYWEPSMEQLRRAKQDKLLYKQVDQIVGLEPNATSSLNYVIAAVNQARADEGTRCKQGTCSETHENRSLSPVQASNGIQGCQPVLLLACVLAFSFLQRRGLGSILGFK
eukprot:TRINITY_DN15002_c0_g1_i1.p1 TRINITY_DN15002_c0_g1~~TRINITY_DN15002_c0_g1_i1.p1  ORF type:complete len:270 (+),score=40.61 TRINITY_DN15002_c0_g1_i1:83-811(+)